jgi:hypothetical protein
MAKGSHSSCAFALVLSQALWVLPGVGPAVAQVTLPPNFIGPDVPHDVPAGSGATIQDLAIFAWQEFIALNWVAMDPAQTGLRGRPNPDVDFLDIAPANGSFPLVVWQTYRHKNELFPLDGTTDISFDGYMPTYNYQNNPKMGTGVNGQIPSFNLFNNLDETSQIGLANMYAHSTSVPPEAQPASGIRVAYEAKVNRAIFSYLVNNGLTNPTNLSNAQSATGPIYGDQNIPNVGICSPPMGVSVRSIILLPCGDIDVPGDAGEGAIEIKAAWRALTPAEMSSGRFFTGTSFSTPAKHPTSSITMQCGGSLPCTSSTRQKLFLLSYSRAGSRSTITMMMHPITQTLRTWRSTIPAMPQFFPISP